jgi:hypothetical protein
VDLVRWYSDFDTLDVMLPLLFFPAAVLGGAYYITWQAAIFLLTLVGGGCPSRGNAYWLKRMRPRTNWVSRGKPSWIERFLTSSSDLSWLPFQNVERTRRQQFAAAFPYAKFDLSKEVRCFECTFKPCTRWSRPLRRVLISRWLLVKHRKLSTLLLADLSFKVSDDLLKAYPADPGMSAAWTSKIIRRLIRMHTSTVLDKDLIDGAMIMSEQTLSQWT